MVFEIRYWLVNASAKFVGAGKRSTTKSSPPGHSGGDAQV